MRNLFIAVCLFAFMPPNPVSASPADSILWVQQNKGLRTLWGVHFIDTLTGWAFGDNGTAYATKNGGAAWSTVSFGTYESINAMSFADCSTAYYCTGGGRIFMSTDTGRTWTQSHYRAGWLSDIRFWNRDTGWAVGSAQRLPYTSTYPVIYRTRNGGLNWDSMSVSGPYGLDYVRTINGRTVYIGGFNYLGLSSNAGTTWGLPASFRSMADSAFSSSSGYINTVDFYSATRGLAVGRYGHILRTANGGTWSTARANDFTWLEAVRYADSNRAVIAGERGAVLSTADGGITWAKRFPRHGYSEWAPWFRSLCIVDPRHLWMVGDSGLIMKGRFYEPGTGTPPEARTPVSQIRAVTANGSVVTIRFSLASPSRVRLSLHEPSGRLLERLDLGTVAAGSSERQWRVSRKTAAGIRFLKMEMTGSRERTSATSKAVVLF